MPAPPQGEFCARKPLHVIGAGALLVGLCLLGLLRFRLETDPLKLWVGPGSQVRSAVPGTAPGPCAGSVGVLPVRQTVWTACGSAKAAPRCPPAQAFRPRDQPPLRA
jgi:hypothetical protein